MGTQPSIYIMPKEPNNGSRFLTLIKSVIP